ncbi:MAG TPA: Mth938-like domain-containing protein, partial [Alphaproteobacteria bacterium]|nr:Mth938-like domain-containing protein [Alphaproteobacteria bacterium]
MDRTPPSLTPYGPRGRPLIEAYGDGRFRIGGMVHTGSVLISPERALPWAAVSLADLSAQQLFDSVAPLLMPDSNLEILLIGCGGRS